MAKKKDSNVIQSTFDFPSVINKFENFNATVNELRTGIYAPIEKISTNSITYKNFVANHRKRKILTRWGAVNIKGNILTQTHRDLLDCILANADETKEVNTGGIAVYFRLSDIVKAYFGSDNKNYAWVRRKLDEIQTTSIDFESTDDSYYSFSILEQVAFSKSHDSFGIVFSADYRKYVEQQLTVNYKAELSNLLKVQSALLRAIIRFFWSHQHCNISVEQILISIGYPVESDRAVKTAKKEIRENEELLNKFGIFYNKKENFIYTQNSSDITFINQCKSELHIETK
jgi:hypothetical protein